MPFHLRYVCCCFAVQEGRREYILCLWFAMDLCDISENTYNQSSTNVEQKYMEAQFRGHHQMWSLLAPSTESEAVNSSLSTVPPSWRLSGMKGTRTEGSSTLCSYCAFW